MVFVLNINLRSKRDIFFDYYVAIAKYSTNKFQRLTPTIPLAFWVPKHKKMATLCQDFSLENNLNYDNCKYEILISTLYRRHTKISK